MKNLDVNWLSLLDCTFASMPHCKTEVRMKMTVYQCFDFAQWDSQCDFHEAVHHRPVPIRQDDVDQLEPVSIGIPG